MYYVYSLQCEDGYYVGCTDQLAERLRRHKNGYIPATKHRRPLELEFYIAVRSQDVAFRLEKYLKTGSGRVFVKRHFVSGDI